jgi:EAL domain-containing protein (putative c-di-GMP-specific phosphodiesterase class I)/GGDEF domain-containing protein
MRVDGLGDWWPRLRRRLTLTRERLGGYVGTGLSDRDTLRTTLQRWVDERPDECRAAVAYFEVDGIAYLTETHGSDSIGDLVLSIAARLADLSSEATELSEMGVGEFAVVRRYDGTDEKLRDTQALDVLEADVNACLRRVSTASQPIPRISMGMATGNLAALRDPLSLLHLAQSLAREARQRGGNTTLREGHGLGARLHRRDDIAMAMHSAVANRELRVVFQPIVDLTSGAPVGAEALLRWTSRPLGIVRPSEFIPLMENHRSMRMIDEWVVNQALQALLRHPSPAMAVSVNASPRSLEDAEYAGSLLTRLERMDVPARRIWLEVTETAFASRPHQVMATLDRLRTAGVRILLDDFGSGYSSLNTFAELPIDWVKLDGQLVSGARDNERQREVVRFATRLARSLGHEVVAEHIETPSDEKVAIEAGCTYGQGYLYSKPTADFASAISLAS